MVLLLYTSFVLFCTAQGATHAFLYSEKGANAVKFNEHIVYVGERGAFLVACFFSTFLKQEEIIIFIASAILSLSFWHNGAYYLTRSKIDKPGWNWFSESTSTTANIEIHPVLRTLMFVIGTGVLIIYCIIKHTI